MAETFGELPAQAAGAALLTDYVLTVSVSIASGVDQIVSAFPNLGAYRIEMAVGMVLLIMLINLRGVRESGMTFAIPTYFFLIMIFATVLFGFIRLLTGGLGTVVDAPIVQGGAVQALTTFLILRAFANGTASVTGVEAISNGITAFKEPRSRNAGATLVIMAAILGSLLLGITFLSLHIGAVPSEQETIISQLTRTVYGQRNLLYLLTIISTTVILMMAANTAFADFPRLGALTASDGFLPRQLSFRGSRLVFSRGIMALAGIASLLLIAFQADVTALIPLYAIGVFLSFSLSQSGMARRWWKSGHLQPGEEIQEPGSVVRHDQGWKHKMIINAVGAVCTFIVMIIFAATKFRDGAWLVIILIPILITIFYTIHRHYKHLAAQLSLENHAGSRAIHHNRVIVPLAGVHRGSLQALRFARTLSDDVTAVHISTGDEDEKIKIEQKWEKWGGGVRLIILNSPYRLFLEPLLDYIDTLEQVTKPNEIITIVVPQFIPKYWWERFLHTRTAESLRELLLHRDNIVITEVPYQVK